MTNHRPTISISRRRYYVSVAAIYICGLGGGFTLGVWATVHAIQ